MPSVLAVISGILIAVTVVQNGDLSLYMGNYPATALVHAVGLVTILLWLWIRREKITWNRRTPGYAYLGGVLGVLTVLGSNLSFAALGVSVSMALMLLGQAAMGVAIDRFGLLGAQKRHFRAQHAVSFAIVAGGIALMLFI